MDFTNNILYHNLNYMTVDLQELIDSLPVK